MDSPAPERCPFQSDRHHNSREIMSTKITSLTPSLPKARGKIKLRGNMKNLRSQPTSVSNHLSRPPEPPSAFLNTRLLSLFLVFSLFISLALGSLVVDETSRTKNWGRAIRTTRSQLRDRANSNYIQHKNSDSSDSFSHRLGHVHHALNWREQNQQEQNQLRYLIARTASMPQLIGRDLHEASSAYSSEQQYRQLGHHDTEHEDIKIVGHHHKRNHHPEPVQRAGSERSVPVALARSVHRLKSPFGTPTTTTNEIDLKRFQLGHSNRFGYDFDSLDVGLGDSDDDEDEEEQVEDSLDDVDDDDDDSVVDSDNDAGGNGLDDGANSKEEDTTTEGTQTEATDESNSIPDSDGDSDDDDEEDVGDDDDQNSVQPERATKNGPHEKKRKQAGTLHRHPTAATRGAKNIHESNPVSKTNSNVSRTDKLAIHISRQQLDEPLEQSRNWGREHDNEVQASSRRMITSPPILDQLELGESRERASHHLRAAPPESPPLAPYQSPVVVSINDNSFVSASPISVGMSSDEQAESSRQFEVSGAPRYSHIISSPKNELHSKRYWHESHIQMIQEEPNELHRGNINSAIIAILFGIGVTGTLIMIVSIKMRSIRERVAYKGRRRSLVPDTDFLINTIPM